MIKNQFKNAVRPLSIAFLCLLGVHANGQDVSLKIHLSGVSKSKITLQSISGSALKTIAEKPVVKNGEIAVLQIPKAQLPAEFVLRFDYQEKEIGRAHV